MFISRIGNRFWRRHLVGMNRDREVKWRIYGTCGGFRMILTNSQSSSLCNQAHSSLHEASYQKTTPKTSLPNSREYKHKKNNLKHLKEDLTTINASNNSEN